MSYETNYLQPRALLRRSEDRTAYGALVLALIALPFILPVFYVGELTFIFIMCIASLGLMTLTGFTGQVSLGQAAFLGIGAYAQAQLLTLGAPLPIALAGAAICAGLIGVAIGMPAIRISGLHLAMVTLAFSIVTEHVLGRWKGVTGGHGGLAVPEPLLFGQSLAGPRAFYFLCFVMLLLVLVLLLNLTRSATGRAFIGIRDSEAAAQALGIHVARTKLASFALSAAISGIAGALLAHHIQYITPDAFGLSLSLQLVLMVFVGGMGSLRGAILGAVLIGLLPSMISVLKGFLPSRLSGQFGLELFVFGAVLCFFVLLEPTGLNGRWTKVRNWCERFPLVRQRRGYGTKVYTRSERAR